MKNKNLRITSLFQMEILLDEFKQGASFSVTEPDSEGSCSANYRVQEISIDGKQNFQITSFDDPSYLKIISSFYDNSLKDSDINNALLNDHLYTTRKVSFNTKPQFVSHVLAPYLQQEGAQAFVPISKRSLKPSFDWDNHIGHVKLKDGTHIFESELAVMDENGHDEAPGKMLLTVSENDISYSKKIKAALSDLDGDALVKYDSGIPDYHAHASNNSTYSIDLRSVNFSRNSLYASAQIKNTNINIESEIVCYSDFSVNANSALIYGANDPELIYLDEDDELINQNQDMDDVNKDIFSKIIAKDINAKREQAFFDAIHDGDIDKVRELIQSGVDINQPDQEFGETGLIYAVTYGQENIFALLLDNNASVDVKNHQGRSLDELLKETNNAQINAIHEKHALNKVIDFSADDEEGFRPGL